MNFAVPRPAFEGSGNRLGLLLCACVYVVGEGVVYSTDHRCEPAVSVCVGIPLTYLFS